MTLGVSLTIPKPARYRANGRSGMRFGTLLAFVGGAATGVAVMASNASRERARQLMMSALKQGIISGREVMRRLQEMNDDLQDLVVETAAKASEGAPHTKASEASAKTERSVHAVRG